MSINNKKIAIGIGDKFCIYKIEDIPFIYDLKWTNNSVVFDNKLYVIYRGKDDITKNKIRHFTKNNNEKYKYVDYSWVKYAIENPEKAKEISKADALDLTRLRGHRSTNLLEKYMLKKEDNMDDFDMDIKI